MTPQEQGADGGPRPRDAREDGQSLQDADEDGVEAVRNLALAQRQGRGEPLEQARQDQQAADERQEQAALEVRDSGVQQEIRRESGDTRRDRRDHDEREVGRLRREGAPREVADGGQNLTDLCAIVDDGRDGRPGVEKERQSCRGRRGDARERRRRQRDATLAGDGDPLQDALEDSQYDGDQHRVHMHGAVGSRT